MKARATGLWFAVVLVSAAGLTVFTSAHDPAQPEPAPDGRAAVSVSAFEGALPVGHLGVPLGTIVRVTGVAVDGDTTKLKANAGKTLLRIDTVDGKKLKRSVDFEFLRAPDAVRKPAAGDRFDYYVHEYGSFDGVVTPPKELNIAAPLVANDGFHYRRYVTVHAAKPVQK